jgi:hypothetical protein
LQGQATLFGPDHAEAIAAHLGEGHGYCLIRVLTLNIKLLRWESSSIGLASVRARCAQSAHPVVSHWYDNYLCGISRLAAKQPNADFVVPAVFNNKEAAAFLAAHSGAISSGLARGTKELFSVVQARQTMCPAFHKSIVL